MVEDDDDARSVTVRVLGRSGYTTQQASSVEHALTRVRKHADDIDLVLTEVGLPDRPGTAPAEELRTLLPGIPVVLMSGFPNHPSPDTALTGEPLDFVEKPFTREQLLRRIRERLDARDPGRRHGDEEAEQTVGLSRIEAASLVMRRSRCRPRVRPPRMADPPPESRTSVPTRCRRPHRP